MRQIYFFSIKRNTQPIFMKIILKVKIIVGNAPIVSQTAPYGPVGMEEWSLTTYPPTDRRNGGMVLSHLPPLRIVGMEEWSLTTYPPTDRRNGGMVGYSVS
jgi:hypothetical protein